MNPRLAAWSPLLPVAMVGTDRHAAPLPAWPGAIGAAIAALGDATRPAGTSPDIDQAAADVLRAAGILAVCGLAGARAQPRPVAAPEAAAVDAQPVADDPAIASWFAWALREGPERLQQAFFLRFAQAGLRLPHALLPVALEIARGSPALRATIQPLLGGRGVWLARQRADWQFAAGVIADDAADPRQWTDGTLEQRKAFLAAERARDPRAARDRFAAALPELPAKERAALAHGLAVGLGPDDEALLDQLRADRGQDVRVVALDLLLRLPAAAHPRRAADRVAALMARGSLLAGRRWTIEPPAEAGADWKADQVDPVVGIAGMGQRAWWLYQLVRQVPLAWWPAHTGLDVKQLAAWADASEWAEPLWRGWRDVLRSAPDPVWAEALLDEWPEASFQRAAKDRPARAVLGDAGLVLPVVSAAVRERYFEARLKSAEAQHLTEPLFAVVGDCGPGETIPPRLASLVVQRLRKTLALVPPAEPAAHTAVLMSHDNIRRTLPALCCTLPLGALADFDDWPAPQDASAAFERARHDSRQIIQARRALDSYLP